MKLSFIVLSLVALSTSAFAEPHRVTVDAGPKAIEYCGGTIQVTRTGRGDRNFDVKIEGSRCSYIDWGQNPGLHVSVYGHPSETRDARYGLVDTVRPNSRGEYTATFHAYLSCDKSEVKVQVRENYSAGYGDYADLYIGTSALNLGNGGYDRCE